MKIQQTSRLFYLAISATPALFVPYGDAFFALRHGGMSNGANSDAIFSQRRLARRLESKMMGHASPEISVSQLLSGQIISSGVESRSRIYLLISIVLSERPQSNLGEAGGQEQRETEKVT